MSAGTEDDANSEDKLRELRRLFESVNDRALEGGASAEDLYRVFLRTQPGRQRGADHGADRGALRNRSRRPRGGRLDAGPSKDRVGPRWPRWPWPSGRLARRARLVAAVAALTGLALALGLLHVALGVRCVLPNNFLVWEATRPLADCGMCRGVDAVLELRNVSRAAFRAHAYTSRPVLVKGAAADWPAMRTFSYDFFKRLYDETEGAYQSVEDECQLLTFKTEFVSLKEVFSMARSRVLNLDGEQPWYIGWSNCHPAILAGMRSEYSRPPFLPQDAEHAHHDFIFMGYSQGAAMHLDYISRLMWQAQLKGHKTWMLTPPPECESECSSFSFSAEPGDIVFLDTRQWYHRTQIEEKEFSLTVSSEYG